MDKISVDELLKGFTLIDSDKVKESGFVHKVYCPTCGKEWFFLVDKFASGERMDKFLDDFGKDKAQCECGETLLLGKLLFKGIAGTFGE